MPPDLEALRRESSHCTNCPLWRHATQTVFGEGAAHARVMLVGEQPGDAEDLAGRPFVGPAGRVLDQALAEAGIDRGETYVTNAVKHFKWEPRGKRRMHKTPAQREIEACRPWLEGELAALQPLLVICLGSTALHALLAPRATITEWRGRVLQREAQPALLATVHPSYILRVPGEARAVAYGGFVADLLVARDFLAAQR